MKSEKGDSLAEAVRNLVKVFAYAQIKDEKTTERKAHFLRVFELTEQEIADLLGKTQPAIHMALTKSKREKKASEETE